LIIFPMDKKKPYSILGIDHGEYIVAGNAIDIEIDDRKQIGKKLYFGGFAATWRMRKEDFLTKEHKQVLRWVKKHEGQTAHDKLLDCIYESEISAHIEKYS
jgi:hypothetical protein